MPDIIPSHAPSPRCLLAWDGTAYRPIKIDDEGVVQVRGENQLFSIQSVLGNARAAVVSGAGGWVESGVCSAGVYWVVTTIAAMDQTTAITGVRINNMHNGFPYTLAETRRAIATWERVCWGGMTVLDSADVVRVEFLGSLAGDTCEIHLTGYIMTVEV